MKRLFILLSTFFLSCFMLFMFYQQRQQVLFSSFPAVDVTGKKTVTSVADRKQFTQALEQLAKDKDSLIARRVVEPNPSGQMVFRYATYGEGALPGGLVKVSEKNTKESDLVSSYLLISGSLSPQELSETFSNLGYSSSIIQKSSASDQLFSVAITDLSLLSLLLLVLTYISLTIIYRIKDLRSAGLRFVSGQHLLSIMWQSFWTDMKVILPVFIGHVFGGGIVLLVLGMAQTVFVPYLLGLCLYQLLLVCLSLGLSLIYLLALKATSLVAVLKGRLPLKRLVTLILIGQFISILAIGWSAYQFWIQFQLVQQQKQIQKKWDDFSDSYQLSYSFSSAFTKGEEQDIQSESWYRFTKDSFDDEATIFVKNNLRQFQVSDISDGIGKLDNHPRGNTIFVSASYLEKEKIPVSAEYLEQMKKLKEGEFGLILPRSLEAQTQYLEELYNTFMSAFSSKTLDSQSPHLFTVKSYTSYVPDGQRRFLYNLDPDIVDQYVYDPVIVVTSPLAMGDTPNSHLFWESEVASSLHLNGYEKTIDSLKRDGVYQWVSYVFNNRKTYYQQLAENRQRLMILFLCSLLGLSTSILLFDTMNTLYFEQYRKDIFLKRMAGMRFEEVHFTYLMIQIAVLGLALPCLIYLTRHAVLSLIVLLLFIGDMLVTLYRQYRIENRQAVTILKGK